MAVRATVQVWGDSRTIRIPKTLARELGLRTGAEVTLTMSGDELGMRPIEGKKRYRLSELLAGCKGKSRHQQIIQRRAGKEIF